MATLAGKVAVVTGGSRGIGLAIARDLMALGATVVTASTSDASAATARAALGAAALCLRADVARPEDVEALFQAVVARHGGVDVLVNNAGVGVFESVERTSYDEWRRVLDTNLTGAFLCTKAALPLMRARGGGWVINVSSLASTAPFAEGAAYCASKAALNAFTDSLLQEVRHDGIRVSVVLPGSVRTEFMGRARKAGSGDEDWKLRAEDVARAVTDLLGHDGRSLPSRVELRPSRPPKRA